MAFSEVRVRFAPSPTGYLHVGGLRTALYNYLFAKKNNGKFILRIEDTDRNRFVEGAVENLIAALHWAGLEFDEGPGKDGGYGPYFQSQRLDIYNKHVDELIKNKKAYHCFCSSERLQQLRDELEKQKLQTKYDKHCLHLSKYEIETKIKNSEPYVIRLNVEPNIKVIINDVIRGRVEFDSNVVDDQILVKSDGYPTYHLANVVDDHLMQISHVIRGEEWLSSTPKHAILYDAFAWERPVFAHLPLLLNADKSKLSKRQGDVAVEDYRDKGYLKDALVNFVALLGWTAGDDQEFYYINELIEKFSLERVNKSGAVFNVEKLDWLNAEHLRKKPVEEILVMFKEELQVSEYKDLTFDDAYLTKIIHAMLERVSFVKEFVTKCPYFYQDPAEYDPDVLKKRWKEDSEDLLTKYLDKISPLTDPTKADYEAALHQVTEEAGAGHGRLIHPLRIASSGVGTGPGVFDILDIIGKEEVEKRIKNALKNIK